MHGKLNKWLESRESLDQKKGAVSKLGNKMIIKLDRKDGIREKLDNIFITNVGCISGLGVVVPEDSGGVSRGLGIALKEHQKTLHLGNKGFSKGVKNNLNGLLMKVEMTRILHVLVREVDHLGQQESARVIP